MTKCCSSAGIRTVTSVSRVQGENVSEYRERISASSSGISPVVGRTHSSHSSSSQSRRTRPDELILDERMSRSALVFFFVVSYVRRFVSSFRQYFSLRRTTTTTTRRILIKPPPARRELKWSVAATKSHGRHSEREGAELAGLGEGLRRSLADSHHVDFIKTNLTAEAAVDLLAPRLYFPQSPWVSLDMLMQSPARSFTWRRRQQRRRRRSGLPAAHLRQQWLK